MSLTNTEFDTILDDPSKVITDPIAWQEDEDHSPSLEFRAEVHSNAGWPLFIKATYNPLIPALSYALILKTVGRVYALDLGKDHHNPQCNRIGEKHKHRWTEQFRDKEAYVPEDITAPATDPVEVWNQFCREAKLTHSGTMAGPPPMTGDLFT